MRIFILPGLLTTCRDLFIAFLSFFHLSFPLCNFTVSFSTFEGESNRGDSSGGPNDKDGCKKPLALSVWLAVCSTGDFSQDEESTCLFLKDHLSNVADSKEKAALQALSSTKPTELNPSVDTLWPDRSVSIGEAVGARLNVIYFQTLDSPTIGSRCRVFVTPISTADMEHLRQFGAQFTAQVDIIIRPVMSQMDNINYSSIFPSALTSGHVDFPNNAKAYFLSKKVANILNREILSAYAIKPIPTAAELAARPTFAFELFIQPAHEFVVEPYTAIHYITLKFIDPQLKNAPVKTYPFPPLK